MTWKKGQSGNPLGRSKRADIITQALIVALNEIDPETDKKRARLLADKLVEKACAGDVAAANAVMDRVEGKPVQINENHNHAGGNLDQFTDEQLIAILSENLTEGNVLQ